ncbi:MULTISPECIES: L-lactate permease [unclassified Thioalkalivibrio]|uniref:L-lactate permease n=1 Tax=unclassified Thioalkalivibrio TaxID=2621013 RepID=UPI00036AFDE9|nr:MULTISPECIES: L-lactate permease [unclassified Thioalkalivibrio]
MTLFWVALVPFVVLFVWLVPLRRPAYEAAPLAYLATLVIALWVWQMPGAVLGASLLDAGVVFVEVMLIVAVALLVLNVMIATGHMDAIQSVIASVSRDPRVLAMLLGWGLVGFVEGIAGFGTPAVLAAPLLVYFGMKPLKAVAIALIGNSTAVPFGAAGTPVVIGFAGLGLDDAVVQEAVVRTAFILALLAVFITIFMTWVATLGDEKGRFREFVPFAVLSALAFGIPYALVAWLIGPELPSIVGGVVAMVVISLAAHKGFLLPSSPQHTETEPAPIKRVLVAFVPFAVMSVALIASRTVMPLREALQSVRWSLGEFQGVELGQSLAPLYTPYFYFALALLTALILFRVGRATLGEAVVATGRKLRVAAIVLIFIIALTQILLMSELNAAGLPSMPQVLGQSLAGWLGGTFVLFSGFLGALGSFMTGSATVSNLLFARLQADTAEAVALSLPSILALQLIGSGVGNMISLHNIAMAAAACGLQAREGQVVRETIVPVVVVCLGAGLLALVW